MLVLDSYLKSYNCLKEIVIFALASPFSSFISDILFNNASSGVKDVSDYPVKYVFSSS